MDICRDAILVGAWLGGDKNAGEILIRENLRRVKRYIAANLSPTTPNFQETVADIAQEAFARVIDDIEDYNGSASFCAWVCGYAKNYMRELIKKGYKYIKLAEKAYEQIILDVEDIPYFADPEVVFLAMEEQRAAKNAFLAMPVEYQEIMYLHSFLGITYKEIAKELSNTEDALRSMHFRAVKLLRKNFFEILR